MFQRPLDRSIIDQDQGVVYVSIFNHDLYASDMQCKPEVNYIKDQIK